MGSTDPPKRVLGNNPLTPPTGPDPHHGLSTLELSLRSGAGDVRVYFEGDESAAVMIAIAIVTAIVARR